MKNIICIDLLNGSLKKITRILENMGISNSLYIHSEDCTVDINSLVDIMNKFPTFNKNVILSKIYINKVGMVVGWIKYDKSRKISEYCNNDIIVDEMLKLESVDKTNVFNRVSIFGINNLSKDELIILSN